MSHSLLDPVDLFLNAQADRRIKKGHLWLYSNEVNIKRSPLKGLMPGQLARLHSASGQALALAFINPNALICGRVVSRKGDESLNRAFIEKRLKQALALREACFSEPYYRLVYGDSDFLPGVVIDRFGDVLVVQIAVAGFDQLLPEILTVLDKLLQPKGVVVRNDHGARALEGLESSLQIEGEVPEQIALIENATRFEFPATSGQKTGWFYDHRMNRAQLQQWVKGQRVLDVFSYLGGWGIEAAQAGAIEAFCVDASQSAIDGVLHNAQLNGLEDRVVGVQGKAIEALKGLIEEGERFDVVVLDPPGFIKKRKDQKAGEAAYRHHNELAMRLLKRGGLLVSGSCSMPLSNEALQDIVHASARHLERQAQRILMGGQGPDHPVHPMIPETEYLKAQFYRVL